MPTKKEKVIGASLIPEIPSNTEVCEEEDNPILALPPKMQRFIHLYLTGQYSVNKLGQLLEVHPNTLGKWLKRQDVKEIIDDMQLITHDMVGIQLKSLTLKAVNKLSDLIESPIDGVALQAVKDTLDRTGHKAKQEIKIDKTVHTFEQRLGDLIDITVDVEELEGEVIKEEE